ncbi:MAG: hypothetical protein B7C24_08815 [Bacteroidetes bacterium 4572_77]|nr:MAG: hypothetical protein B7C24_08815 [Bacteroidetes bacterium 4572_77]
MKKDYKIVVKILPFAFVLLLVLPKINSYLKIIPEIGNTENRKMAELPVFDLNLLDPFPQQYDHYFEDHFSLRNQLLSINNLFNYFILEKSIAEHKVVLGLDGWLFRNNNALPINANIDYTNVQKKNLQREFEERTQYYKSLGIDYYAFIIPNKATIYSEFVKERYSAPNGEAYETRIDRLMSFLSQHSNLENVFYLKDYLREHKADHQLYYKKDHHWNYMGGLYATFFINQILKEKYPAIDNTALPENYAIEIERKYNGNLAQVLGIRDILKDDVVFLHPKEGIEKWKKGKKRDLKPTKDFAYPWAYQKSAVVVDTSLPKALVIRDSFGNALLPFLNNSFSDVLYIWDAWQYGWNKEIVAKEKPDIILNIMVEQHIYHMVTSSDLEYEDEK